MNGQPSSPQAVVYNISNTNGNNYVNATPPEASRAECPTLHAQSMQTVRSNRELQRCLLLMVNTMSQHVLTPLIEFEQSNGFRSRKVACTLGYAQSPNKESIDSILDGNNHSFNKPPTNEDTATETNPTYQ